METVFLTAKEKMGKTIGVLKSEYSSIRAGRANAAVLDKIRVDYYGVTTPINQMAAISVAEARILNIQPWDMSTLHAIEKAEPGTHTDFTKPFVHFQNFLHRRGIVVVMSDFYEDPEVIVKTVEPLRYHGNEVILFHLLDPQELKPTFREPVLLYDLEETTKSLEVSPEYAHNEYRHKIDAHIEALRSKARGSGMDYFLMDTGRPLDEGLREYLQVRKGRL